MNDPKEKFSEKLHAGLKAIYDAKYKNAIELLTEATELDPSSINAWYNLGKAYSSMDNCKQAIHCYTKTVELEETATNYYNLACEYYGCQEYEEAIKAYERATKLDKNYSLAFDGLGSSYGFLEDFDKAIEFYKKAHSLEEKNAKFLSHLG